MPRPAQTYQTLSPDNYRSECLALEPVLLFLVGDGDESPKRGDRIEFLQRTLHKTGYG